MNGENKVEAEILRKFMYNDKLRYNDIWDKEMCSGSHFDYFLKKIIEMGLIKKDNNNYYRLTNVGLNYLTSLEGKETREKKKPVPCAFVIVKRDDKVLLNVRTKQPFLGYLNIPGGKIEIGKTAYEQAEQELEEETGLVAKKLRLSCVSEKISKDRETNEVIYHIIGYFFVCEDFEGNLKQRDRECENSWYSLSDIKNYKRFQDIDIIINHAFGDNDIKFYVIERILQKEEIVDYSIREVYND